MRPPPFFWYVLPVFLATILAEALYLTFRKRKRYDWGGAGASLGVALGQKITNRLSPLVFFGVATLAWRHRLATVPIEAVWGKAACFLATELVYYWHHRLSHEVRWMWASHSVHHSANEMTFSAAYRLGWFSWLSGGWLLFVPLFLVGFPPRAVAITMALNLIYQFWLHTELVPKLGALELVLNTPSHHRVHHATNTRYLDRNYGGVLIVFDRLFGTFAEESADERCRYGLVEPLTSRNPFVIATHEWLGIARDLARAGTWRDRLGFALGPPGWSPDGTRLTTRMLQRRAGISAGPDRSLRPRAAAS